MNETQIFPFRHLESTCMRTKIKCFEASMENQTSDNKIVSLRVHHLEDDEDEVMLMTVYKICFIVTIMHPLHINSCS